jgi:hypothetical protein
MPERALELQLDLTTCWHQAEMPSATESLRRVATSRENPFEVVSAVVKSISMRSIKKFRWAPPFAWADLEIDPTELATVAWPKH